MLKCRGQVLTFGMFRLLGFVKEGKHVRLAVN